MTQTHQWTIVHVNNPLTAHASSAQLLREAGYRVIEASTNEEACSVAEREGSALLLLCERDGQEAEKFRVFADHAPALLWMNGPDGCEFVNKAYLDFLGVRAVDARGFDWAQFVHPDDRKSYLTAYFEAEVEGRFFEGTFRFRRYDGEYRWMKSVGTPRFGTNGVFIGYAGSTVELTDMHAASQQLGQDHDTIEGRKHTSGLELKSGADTGRRVSRTLTGYAIAVGSIVLALLVRFAIDLGLGDHLPYVTFFIAVAMTTWFGGLGPSLAAVVLGGLASNWYFISPRHALWIAGSMHQVGYVAYFAVALSIVGLGQAWRKAQWRAETLLTGLRAELSIRRRVEEALRESREQLRQALQFDEAVMANMGEGLYTVDRNGLVMSMNHAAEELFGWTSAELLGRKMHDVTHYKHRDGTPFSANECVGLQVLSQGNVLKHHEDVFIRKDGSFFDVVYSSSPIRAGGEIIGLVVVFRDVSDRKQAEAALQENEGRLRMAMAAGEMGAWDIDLTTGTVTWDAKQYDFLRTGIGEAPTTADTLYELVHQADVDRVKKAAIAAMGGSGRFSQEFRILHPDKGIRWVAGHGTVITDQEGSPVRIIGVNYDITERKESQARIERFTEELEREVAERTQELVQSQDRLRALATELNLAEQRERKRLATELHDHLQQMLVLGRLKLGTHKRFAEAAPAAAKVMKETDEVLSDALQYTRTLVAELSPTVLRDYGLAAGLKWLGEYMKKHEITVTVTVPEEELKLPEDQVVLLFQSVRELLINSSKHAEIGEATVTMEQHQGNLSITVSDNGKGFDLAAAAAAAAGTPSGGISSKFGLFSIQERMRALDGSLSIRSAPGQGTTAMLVLPLARNADDDLATAEISRASVVRAAESVKKSGSRTKGQAIVQVLLVDDHAMVRQGLRSVLDAYDDLHVVAEARDGAEAVKLVGDLHPRVVVMDINMPRMNGIDATTHIKSRWPETTVIGISVNTGEDNSDAMKRAGAAAVLPKDSAVDQLHDAIVQEVGISADEFTPPH